MLAFAAAALALGARQKDGKTLQWHLEKVRDSTGRAPPQLDIPPAPYELEYLWAYFVSLNRKRTAGAAQLNPLSDAQILAWERRNRLLLTPFESECIDALDDVFLEHAGRVRQAP